jgi:hypothetical protein
MKTKETRPLRITLFLLIVVAIPTFRSSDVRGWGPEGHEISGRAAAMKLPKEMPGFMRQSVDQLAYLNFEPDRWRDKAESNMDKALNSASAPDHFLDLEIVPERARNAVNRYDFVAEMIRAGQKPSKAGFLPYRILELFQRLRVDFRLWRAETDPQRRQWIEQRIVNDAGILGHFVSDGANPHHTTIHFNGWNGYNPQGYTRFSRERGIHYRFEEEFVGARVKLNDVTPLVSEKAKIVENPREEIWRYLRDSNALVEQLYILDKKEQFSKDNVAPEHKKFVAARLAAGAQMLRDLWWTAWVTSDPALAPAAPSGPATKD